MPLTIYKKKSIFNSLIFGAEHNFFSHFFALVHVPAEHEDLGLPLGQVEGDGLTDARVGAGHQVDFIIEFLWSVQAQVFAFDDISENKR
jgi:hypothetical protein